MVTVIFWISLFLLLYCYIGYPVFLFLVNKAKSFFSAKKAVNNEGENIPVTLIVAMHNEAAVLEEKIRNTFALDYPKENLYVIFVDDGSTDGSPEIAEKYPDIELIRHEQRRGKAAAIRSAMQKVKTPVVIFSDANSMLNKQSIKKIVRHYRDSFTGGVAGEKRVLRSAPGSDVGNMEGIYWRYESFLKKQESDFYTTVGAAGELFSIRTSLFRMTDDDVITDDFLISMKVCLQGYRVAYEPDAYSSELSSASLNEEAKRKIRIASGAYQSIGYIKGSMNFFRYPLLSFQYFSHRLLRWVMGPFLIPVIFLSNVFIILNTSDNIYHLLFYAQLLFYLIAFTGWLLVRNNRKGGALTAPFYFLFTNFCLLEGLIIFLKGQHTVLWQRSLRAEATAASDQL